MLLSLKYVGELRELTVAIIAAIANCEVVHAEIDLKCSVHCRVKTAGDVAGVQVF